MCICQEKITIFCAELYKNTICRSIDILINLIVYYKKLNNNFRVNIVHEGVHHHGCSFFMGFFVFQEVIMQVNGEFATEKNISLADFLQKYGYQQNKVVVELNGEIISRKNYGNIMLTDEDELEIVCFVGGG